MEGIERKKQENEGKVGGRHEGKLGEKRAERVKIKVVKVRRE